MADPPAVLRRIRRRCAVAPLLAAATVCMAAVSGCGGGASAGGDPASPVTLRLGYLPNLTHATAMVAIDRGYLGRALGSSVTLKAESFNAGPAESEALAGGALDLAYMGPSPAVNAFIKSRGTLVRIVAGMTSGGAALVVRSGAGITSAADLRGKRIATPQLGNTQDVALRTYLAAHGLHTDPQGGGDVRIVPTDNATMLLLFASGQVDGAWVPEPYASRLVDEDQGSVLVDEAALWPGGRFPTAVLVARADFLSAHPDVVQHVIEAQLDAQAWMADNPQDARTAADDALLHLTQKRLSTRVLDDAWSRLTFTDDPIAPALATEVRDARTAGLLPGSADINGILDLRILNRVLSARGQAAVDSGALGVR